MGAWQSLLLIINRMGNKRKAMNNKTHLYPQNSTFGLGTIKPGLRVKKRKLRILFHEHPSKRVAEGVSLVVNLIGCSRQVGLCTWHLGARRCQSGEILDGSECCAHDANFWRRLGHVDSGAKNEIIQLFYARRTITLSFGARWAIFRLPLSAFDTRIRQTMLPLFVDTTHNSLVSSRSFPPSWPPIHVYKATSGRLLMPSQSLLSVPSLSPYLHDSFLLVVA